MADDDTTGRSTDDVTEEPTAGVEEMSLDELREEIQTIDREIVELIAQRTYVAETIAAVKREQGLPTTDEQQEQAVMDREARTPAGSTSTTTS
jgi:chorismate mutase